MAVREKLVELLAEHCAYKEKGCVGCDEGKYYRPECKTNLFGKIADHLIANGVTAQEWISRSEPPKKNGRYLCRYVFNEHYNMPFEQVLSFIATDKTPHFQNEGDDLGMKVTHWMPLPPAPKGE